MEGSVVQLVRMPPCHGGGRGFESRPVRKKASQKCEAFFVPCHGGGRPEPIRDPVRKKKASQKCEAFFMSMACTCHGGGRPETIRDPVRKKAS